MQEITKNYTRFELITVIIAGLIALSFLAIITTNLSINYTEVDYSEFTVSGQDQYNSKSSQSYIVNYEMVIKSENVSSLLIWTDQVNNLKIDLMKVQFNAGINGETRKTIDFDRDINSNGLEILFPDISNGINLRVIGYESLGFTFEDYWLNASDTVDPPSDEEINIQFLDLYTEEIEIFNFNFNFIFEKEKILSVDFQRNQAIIFTFIIVAIHFVIVKFALHGIEQNRRKERYYQDQNIQIDRTINPLIPGIFVALFTLIIVVIPFGRYSVLLYFGFLVIGLTFGTIIILSLFIEDVNSVIYLIPLSFSHIVWFFYFGLTNDYSFTVDKIPEMTTSFFGYLPRFAIASLSITLTIVSAFLYFYRYLRNGEIRNKNLSLAILTYILHLSFILFIY